MLHGRLAEADAVLAEIERRVVGTADLEALREDRARIRIRLAARRTPIVRMIARDRCATTRSARCSGWC